MSKLFEEQIQELRTVYNAIDKKERGNVTAQ
jgi:hypothetical protein